jgi:hypothetical protein
LASEAVDRKKEELIMEFPSENSLFDGLFHLQVKITQVMQSFHGHSNICPAMICADLE